MGKHSRKAFTLTQAKRIKELLDEGKTVKQVMVQLNFPQSAVNAVIRHWGEVYASDYELQPPLPKPSKIELVKAQRSADKWLQKQLA